MSPPWSTVSGGTFRYRNTLHGQIHRCLCTSEVSTRVDGDTTQTSSRGSLCRPLTPSPFKPRNGFQWVDRSPPRPVSRPCVGPNTSGCHAPTSPPTSPPLDVTCSLVSSVLDSALAPASPVDPPLLPTEVHRHYHHRCNFRRTIDTTTSTKITVLKFEPNSSKEVKSD